MEAETNPTCTDPHPPVAEWATIADDLDRMFPERDHGKDRQHIFSEAISAMRNPSFLRRIKTGRRVYLQVTLENKEVIFVAWGRG